MQHFWAPEIDPAHPMDCTLPERYVLKRLPTGLYLGIEQVHQGVIEVEDSQGAYLFHTHEAALRAADQLNRLGKGPVDVMKVE
jgi:RNA-binding protein YlmH